MGRTLRALLAAALVTVGLVAATADGAQAGNGYFTKQDLTTAGGEQAGYSTTVPQWYTPWDRVRHIAYVGVGNIAIGSQQSSNSTWSWTTTPEVPYIAWIVAYAYSWDHSSHIIYSSSDGHLHELWYSEASPTWHDGDLTASTGAPANLLVRSGFEQGGQQHLVASGLMNGHIWEFNFRPGYGWQATDLNTTTGATALGLAVGAGRGDTYGQTIAYYGSTDHRAHALTWTSSAGWSDVALTAPLTASDDLTIFASPAGDRVTITYHTNVINVGFADLHMVTWTAATGWTDTDVTAATGAPDDFNTDGQGVYLQSDGSDRFYQCDVTGQIQEYVHTSDGRWFAWLDAAQGFTDGSVEPAALAFPADNEGRRWTVSVASIDNNDHVNLLDMTN